MKTPCMTVFPALSALLLSACATGSDQYPSLARRDAERITGSASAVETTPVAPPTAVPPNLELAARLERLVDQARSAHARFESRLPRANRASGSGWAEGAIALAELDSARSEAMVALADLDELFAAEKTAGREAAAITAARDQVMAWISQEDRALSALRQ